MTEDPTATGLTEATPTEPTEAGSPRRRQSTIQFPYNDLDDAIVVARKVWDHGAQCDLAQLAGALGQKPKSGAFRTKVLASKMFGLIQGTQNLVLTPLGHKMVDPKREAAARAEAFLEVPLFSALFDAVQPSGGMLPNGSGLDALIRKAGVVESQVENARAVFQRSASQAGYHRYGRERLVRPAVGNLADESEDEGGDGGGIPNPPGEDDKPAIMTHPLIVGMLGALPEPGDDFPEEDRELWLQAAKVNLQLIYGKPKTQSVRSEDEDERHAAGSLGGTYGGGRSLA